MEAIDTLDQSMNSMKKEAGLVQRLRSKWQYLLIAALILLSPVIVRDEYVLRICVMIFIYSILSLSLNFIAGFGGLLSFGHAAFYGIGAYTTAILMTRYGYGFVPSLFISGAMAFVFGILLGLPALRVQGDYICLVTLAAGEMFRVTMQSWQSFSGGQMGIVGIPVPTILGLRIVSNTDFFYLTAILMAVTFGILAYLGKSKVGRAIVAIREDELAATALGINTAFYKVICFAIGTFFAGIAGCIIAVYLTTIGPSNFDMNESILMVIMMIVGGVGSLPGSVLGAALLIILIEVFRPIYEYRLLIIGMTLIAILIWHPQGIMGIKAWQKRSKQ